MKKRLLAVLAATTLSIGLPAQCLLPLDASMDATLQVLWEQYLERGDTSQLKIYQRKYEQSKKAAARPKAEAFFRSARAHLIEKLGEEIFCQRVDMDLWSAFKFYGKIHQIQFRFFLGQAGTAEEASYHVYHFSYDTRKDSNQIYYPEVLDCHNYPDSCHFKIINGEQALNLAEAAGFMEDSRHHQIRQGSWYWEIEKLINDNCKARKVKIDMYTGQLHYSDYYTWFGCITLEKKVERAPLVIEGTILGKKPGYYHNGNIWSSCLVEVNRLFKGEVSSGVVDVIAFGGQLGNRFQFQSHGQVYFPEEGQTAIFFLLAPDDKGGSPQSKGIDSLSPYPIYHVIGSPMVLFPDVGWESSFTLDIERNTYQAIEAAAGQKRQTLILPAIREQAFVNWAVDNRFSVPCRQPGLEYVLFPQKPAPVKDTLAFYIGLNALSIPSYLSRSRIVLQYNPAAVGDSIVSKNKLECQLLHRVREAVAAERKIC